MMHFWSFLCVSIILCVSLFDAPAQQDQSILTHCLDTLAQGVSLSEVEIDGVIFASSGDGIRAIRNNIPTSYLIAPSDHYRSFGTSGTFSPDGKWFVFPTGTSSRANWLDRHYHLTRLNFVSTYTGLRIFSIPIDEYLLFVSGSHPMGPHYATTNWLSNIHYILDEDTVLNVDTQTPEAYSGAIPLQELAGGIISPDFTQMIIGRRILDIASGETLFETDNSVRWLADGTGYYTVSSNPTNTSVYEHDGSLRFSDNHHATVSSTGKWLAWSEQRGDYPNVNHSFFIMNTRTEQVIELCTRITDIMFSPNDTQAALLIPYESYQSQLWLIDLETWEATPVNVYLSVVSRLVGWYINEDE